MRLLIYLLRRVLKSIKCVPSLENLDYGRLLVEAALAPWLFFY
jgi:hypothetical protein